MDERHLQIMAEDIFRNVQMVLSRCETEAEYLAVLVKLASMIAEERATLDKG